MDRNLRNMKDKTAQNQNNPKPHPPNSVQTQMRGHLPLAPLAGAVCRRRHLQRPLSTATSSPSPPTPSTPPSPPPPPLSPADLAAVSALLPRLVAGGRHAAAGRLLSAALLLSPSPSSLPFPLVASHLASLPTLSPAMSLLTALRHHPLAPSPLPLAAPLLSALLLRGRAGHAAAVLRWLCRPGSLHRPDEGLYRAAIDSFCRLECARDALIALKEMALDGIAVSPELRGIVKDGLLQDARVDEALELDAAIRGAQDGGGSEGPGKVVEVIDRLLGEWEE